MVGTILLLAATLLPTPNSLATSMEDWPIKFHPHLDLAATYDDNILIAHDHERSDLCFTVSPGLQLLYGDVSHDYLSLDYTTGIQRFLQHGSEDANNH